MVKTCNQSVDACGEERKIVSDQGCTLSQDLVNTATDDTQLAYCMNTWTTIMRDVGTAGPATLLKLATYVNKLLPAPGANEKSVEQCEGAAQGVFGHIRDPLKPPTKAQKKEARELKDRKARQLNTRKGEKKRKADPKDCVASPKKKSRYHKDMAPSMPGSDDTLKALFPVENVDPQTAVDPALYKTRSGRQSQAQRWDRATVGK
jgi:hypothetical protein